MKTLFAIVSVMLLQLISPAFADEKTDKAVEVAEKWLALIDAGSYNDSWEEAAAVFKKQVTADAWEASLKRVRVPLGACAKRVKTNARFYTDLPGAEKGEYVVIQFKTEFASKPAAIETVTPMKEADGSWKVSGYFIK